MNSWYSACDRAAEILKRKIAKPYSSRTFSGILGDLKALSPQKALSLVNRKKGLGKQCAYLYLARGIDGGRGYQACSAEALCCVLKERKSQIIREKILDVGCSVGVTAGAMGLNNITGFDLLHDFVTTAKLVDSFTGAHNTYFVADMTIQWPLDFCFNTVICGLVCHYLKKQANIVTFFSEANRVLEMGGSLVITLPSGTVSTATQLAKLLDAVEKSGFLADRTLSGLVLSTDSSHSQFWMFVITARKVSESVSDVFIHHDFGFPLYRTPVSREAKGKQAKETATKIRMVKHETFKLITLDELEKKYGDKVLIYKTVATFI